jgi:hypothetical protein
MNKAKKRRKELRQQSEDAAAEVKKLKARIQSLEFKATIKGNMIVDADGMPVRKYSWFERFLDNKPLAYGVLAAIIGALLIYMFVWANN